MRRMFADIEADIYVLVDGDDTYDAASAPALIERLIEGNLDMVTGACLMVRREVFDEVGGFEEKLTVAYNDVDLCLKIREKGYLIVYTPYAELYHHESMSRGYEDTSERQARFAKEVAYMQSKWQQIELYPI